MAITTRDQAIAGMRPPVGIVKAGITMAAVGVPNRLYTPWYVSGVPGASTANSAGINGVALTPGSSNVEGRIIRTNPTGGASAYLANWTAHTTQAGVLYLIDRLWHNSALSVTSTTAQAITPATLPARDSAGTTNGNLVYAGIEWSATGGAGTPLVTLTYTNQDGTTSRTGTFNAVTTPPVGTFEMFTLQAGDTGIRAPTSLIQTATRTSGTMHLVLFRILAALPVGAGNIPTAIDVLTGGRPQILDDSVLQLLWLPGSTTALSLASTLIETHG